MKELRFIFESDNGRIEEVDDLGNVVKSLYADFSTLQAYFRIWQESNYKLNSIAALDKILLNS